MQDLHDYFILPEPCPDSTPSWFGFLITCKVNVNRNELVKYLENNGIQTRMLFAGNLTKHPCFDQMREETNGYRIVGDLHNSNRIMTDTFWIGVYPGMTDIKLNYMIEIIHNFFEDK